MTVKLCDGGSAGITVLARGRPGKGLSAPGLTFYVKKWAILTNSAEEGLILTVGFLNNFPWDVAWPVPCSSAKKLFVVRGQHAKRNRSYFDHSAVHRDCVLDRHGTHGETSTMA